MIVVRVYTVMMMDNKFTSILSSQKELRYRKLYQKQKNDLLCQAHEQRKICPSWRMVFFVIRLSLQS
ncbi:hypothetical protein EZS27_041365, partial [termite gut metagenome]